jgi:hypothetical protein
MSNGQTRSPSLGNIRCKEDGEASGALDGRSLCELQYWNPADATGDGSLQQLSVRLACGRTVCEGKIRMSPNKRPSRQGCFWVGAKSPMRLSIPTQPRL